MPNYGQTSKDIQEEYEKEEEPIEQEYVRTFPKKHSSLLPHMRLNVKIPDSMSCINRIRSEKIKIPCSDIYNREWRNFNTGLFGKKRR